MRHIQFVLIAAATLSITACSKHYQPINNQSAHVTTRSTITTNSLVQQVRNQGAVVVQQGARLQIVLSTDKLFQPLSLKIKPNQVYTLRLVSNLIQKYGPNATIQVRGYTSNVQTPSGRKITSTQYAKNVASFLWNDGISKHSMKINGYGMTGQVASNRTPQGSAYNRRVEILVNYP